MRETCSYFNGGSSMSAEKQQHLEDKCLLCACCFTSDNEGCPGYTVKYETNGQAED